MPEEGATGGEATPQPIAKTSFPPYAFVGREAGRPHPTRDPGGHSYGREEGPPPPPLDPERPGDSAAYRRGFALFDAGYYWEAHEAWEGLWHAAGRAGLGGRDPTVPDRESTDLRAPREIESRRPTAELLRGLIKLAAAGVKVRQRRPAGVRSHGERAAGHFAAVRRALGRTRFAGLDLDALEAFARDVAAHAAEWPADPERAVEVVFDRRLGPPGGVGCPPD